VDCFAIRQCLSDGRGPIEGHPSSRVETSHGADGEKILTAVYPAVEVVLLVWMLAVELIESCNRLHQRIHDRALFFREPVISHVTGRT